jgi:sugar (pentulose or hexulose) kinase
VTGRPLIVYPAERDAAFGAALLAGVGAGLWSFDDVDTGLEARRPRVYEPREDVGGKYARLQPAYEGLYGHLRDVLRLGPDR